MDSLDGVVTKRQALLGFLALYVALLLADVVGGIALAGLAADVLASLALLAAGIAYAVVFGNLRWPLTVAAGLVVVGGLAGGYDAFAQAGYVPVRPLLVTVSNVSLLVAFALYLYDVYA